MSIELVAQATLQNRTDSATFTASKTISASGNHDDGRKLTIGTSEEEITISADVTSGGNGAGYLFIKNHDATNYVELGHVTTVYGMRLDAGWVGLIPLNSTVLSLFLKANTGACVVELRIYERGA